MDYPSILTNLAEICVALLGFAGIVITFSTERAQMLSSGRFWSMVAAALIGLSASLFPLPIFAMLVSPRVLFTGASGALLIVGFFYATLTARWFIVVRAPTDASVNRTIVYLLVGFTWLVCVLLVGGLIFPKFTAAAYLFAITWYIFLGAFLFIRMIWTSQGPGNQKMSER